MKTKKLQKARGLIMLILATIISTNVWGQTYHLSAAVSSVAAGKKYVFKESSNNYVLTNTISSSKLSATGTFNTTGLTGSEDYVWTLETASGGFYMKNMGLSGTNIYLQNSQASGGNLAFTTTSSDRVIWSFAFSAGTATITCVGNSRFIGNNGSDAYKTYASDSYAHLFYVYEVVADATYAVVWKSNGETVHTDAAVSSGTTVSTPSNPSVPLACGEGTFMGWTAIENYSANSAPGDLFNGTSPAITAATTFYAVFADEVTTP